MSELFRKFSHKTSEVVGSPWAFISAFLVIILWVVSGPVFGFSDTWQLVINTGTTIITFLMVFLIQNTQNRDSKAIHLKLDELIVAQKDARNSMLDLEDLSDKEIQRIQDQFNEIWAHRTNPQNTNSQAGDSEGEDNNNERQPAAENTTMDKMKRMATRN
ncbi:MAG: low affinity iron permease family protein [Chloroflexi bacterium]|nr:low affinity iron permease family protein [Chloroflexota bacterium]OJV86829.1 MAG: hypothetical protein BGO39_13445 [Chloroflexi bacterium 54-19]